MYLLDNPIRPYAWGSTTAIPELLGVPPTGEPQAELWMGAHPASPSRIGDRTLLDLVTADPEGMLGGEVAEEFEGRLPFLLKLLAAAEPLSLQAHPDPIQARAGFERENAAGVPLSAPERSYQDAYAKPELICALTPFEAMVGFRPVAEVLAEADKLAVPALAAYLEPLRDRPDADGMRRCFTALMSAPAGERARAVGATVAAARKSELRVADLLVRLGERYPGDPGVVAALLLNHVFLEPGEALFLPAGNLHAYVRGFGVELLANSDNVLRGGLTSKHIDVPELLSILDFTPRPADILRAGDVLRPADVLRAGDVLGAGDRSADVLRPGDVLRAGAAVAAHGLPDESAEEVYPTPAREFRLSRIRVRDGEPVRLRPAGPQVLLCTAGRVVLRSGNAVVAGSAAGVDNAAVAGSAAGVDNAAVSGSAAVAGSAAGVDNAAVADNDGFGNAASAGPDARSVGEVELGPGRSVFVGANEGVVVLDGDGSLFRATANLA